MIGIGYFQDGVEDGYVASVETLGFFEQAFREPHRSSRSLYRPI